VDDRKKEIVEGVLIEGMSSDGRGFAHINGKVVFAEFAVPGDVADIEIRKNKKKYGEGVLAALQKTSTFRVQAPCRHFGVCGGCKWQHIDYAEQLKFKRQIVEDAFTRIGKLSFPEIPAVIGCADNYYYRNKLEFTFTDRRWLLESEIQSGQSYEHRNGLGFHVPESFSGVLDIEHCYLQADPSNKIRLAVKDFALKNNYSFFNLSKQYGLMRNLMIRTSSTGQILVLLSFFENDQEKIDKLMQYLGSEFPEITSLQYVINPKRNDTIYDLETQVYKGEAFIIEQLGGYKFKIGPKSFFQTNPVQAKVLYDVTKNFAALKSDDVVYDLYTGVGSIALYVSADCKSVTGIEQVEAAILDARANAELNSVLNCSFFAGDVRMVLQPDFIARNGKPSIVITDPPRAGMHDEVVRTLLKLESPEIVYVSCNPATQARDLQLLAEKYDIKAVQPVDMFPHTTHIENVAKLELR
jgi:23S rRNA (uracil1939-C5)-methyltransferase